MMDDYERGATIGMIGRLARETRVLPHNLTRARIRTVRGRKPAISRLSYDTARGSGFVFELLLSKSQYADRSGRAV
jgi:hypothetical protein